MPQFSHITHLALVFAGFAWGLPNAFAQNKTAEPVRLSLTQAWQEVSEVNPSLVAARRQVERRVAEHRATAYLVGPQVEVSGKYTWIDDPIVIDLDPIRSAILALHPGVSSNSIPSFTQQVQDDQFLSAQLTATLPIYTGGRIKAARRASQAAVEQAEAEARAKGESLLSELVKLFYGAHLARVSSQTRASVLEGSEEHLRQAKRLEEEGFIARTDVLNARVARDDAWRKSRLAERQVEIAEIALAGLLAREGRVEPTSSLFIMNRPLQSLDTFLASMQRNHPALAIVEAKRRQSEQGVAAEQGKLLPELYLFGRQELNKSDLTILEPEWAVGLGVNLILWDRQGVRQRVKAARLLERRVELMGENLKLNLRTLVRKSYLELAQAQEQFASLESSLALTQENLRARQAAFREGQGTSLEVVDAQLSLAKAKTERAVAAYQFDVALITLLEASGQPDAFFTYEAEASERISQ